MSSHQLGTTALTDNSSETHANGTETKSLVDRLQEFDEGDASAVPREYVCWRAELARIAFEPRKVLSVIRERVDGR